VSVLHFPFKIVEKKDVCNLKKNHVAPLILSCGHFETTTVSRRPVFLQSVSSCLLWDSQLSPPPQGVPFKRNFMSVAKTILKRLFRVYAHIYHQHFDSVMQLQEEAHLNTSFKHFIFFVQVPPSSLW